jgi:hypothetical protein
MRIQDTRRASAAPETSAPAASSPA